jgi:YbgC/YbaW family acyl-CoA thioester hydrolase
MKQNIIKRTIAWGDLDALGIVFYPRYYEWIDAGAHLFFASLRLDLSQLWRERDILFGLAETQCQYFRPGRYRQQIEIVTHIDSLEQKTIVFNHMIRDLSDGNQMVEGQEKRICLNVSNPNRFRAIDIPDDIYRILKEASQ